MIVVEVASALSAASNVLTFGYTNAVGTAGRTTGNLTTTASSIAGRVIPASGLFVPLQDGDVGVRSIEGMTLVSGTGTGEICVSIVRPLAILSSQIAPMWNDRDLVLELPALPRIFTDSCISAFFISATASATFTWNAVVRVCEN
jgi:hypothetical protein